MKGKKCFGLLLVLSIIFGALFVGSSDVSAASVSTSYFDLDYMPVPNSNYRWYNGLLYGNSVILQYARRYQFTTASITPTGNYASIHFETNIVANASSQQYLNFVNRDYIGVYACSSSVSGSLRIQASSISTAVTTWTDSQNRPSKTLTVYGDVSLGGLSVNTSQQIVCGIGSSNYAFFSTNYTANTANMYFEQNPMSIIYTNNESESLLQSQVYQNNTIINQNNETNQYLSEQAQKDQQDRDDLQNASQDAQTGANSSQQSATSTGTTLLGAFSAFVNALVNASPSNCNIDMDMGNLDLGIIDFCTLSLPQPFPTIASIFLILFCVPLSIATARKVISLFRSFQ